MTEDDIIVVAPYNAQVNALRDALPAGIRVGTVDKFQGQEAPICIVSMTASSAETGISIISAPNLGPSAGQSSRPAPIIAAIGARHR